MLVAPGCGCARPVAIQIASTRTLGDASSNAIAITSSGPASVSTTTGTAAAAILDCASTAAGAVPVAVTRNTAIRRARVARARANGILEGRIIRRAPSVSRQAGAAD